MKDMGAYQVMYILVTDRRSAVRPMSENLDISTFTAHNMFSIKKTCLLIKCASLGTKEGVFIETWISF